MYSVLLRGASCSSPWFSSLPCYKVWPVCALGHHVVRTMTGTRDVMEVLRCLSRPPQCELYDIFELVRCERLMPCVLVRKPLLVFLIWVHVWMCWMGRLVPMTPVGGYLVGAAIFSIAFQLNVAFVVHAAELVFSSRSRVHVGPKSL